MMISSSSFHCTCALLCDSDKISLAVRSSNATLPIATPTKSISFVVSRTLNTCFGMPIIEFANDSDFTSLVYADCAAAADPDPTSSFFPSSSFSSAPFPSWRAAATVGRQPHSLRARGGWPSVAIEYGQSSYAHLSHELPCTTDTGDPILACLPPLIFVVFSVPSSFFYHLQRSLPPYFSGMALFALHSSTHPDPDSSTVHPSHLVYRDILSYPTHLCTVPRVSVF